MVKHSLLCVVCVAACASPASTAPVVFFESWEDDTAGVPPLSPWYVDPCMPDGSLTVIAGSDYSWPFSGGNQGFLVNGAGFNGKNAGNQARLTSVGMQVQALDGESTKLKVQYYAKGKVAGRAEWYLEISLGDVHAPRLADLPPPASLPEPIPVIAYCKPLLDPSLPHHSMAYFNGQKWLQWGALDWNLTWQKFYYEVKSSTVYMDCGCNNNPVTLPRAYLGGFDRVSIHTLDGIYSDYTVLDDVSIVGGQVVHSLGVSPDDGLVSAGPVGGPLAPPCKSYTLTNMDWSPIDWSVSKTQPWLTVSPSSGTLARGASVNVNVCVTADVNALPLGLYSDQVMFTDLASGVSQTRSAELCVGQVDNYTELFAANNNLDHFSLTFTPDGSAHHYQVCRTPATQFPTSVNGASPLVLAGDDSVKVTLQQGAQVHLYGAAYSEFHVGANGYLTFGSGDTLATGTLENHFAKPRISGLFVDLAPQANHVSVKQLLDRVAVTYNDVPEAGKPGTNSFQIELFYDGRIRLTWLDVAATGGLVGLSRGQGVPTCFQSSDFSAYTSCPPAEHPADFDLDGDVDQSDFGHLQSCIGAESVPILRPLCADADLDMNAMVNLQDTLAFLRCLSGPDVPPVADCLEP